MRFRSEVVPIGDGWLALHLVNAESFSAMVIAENLESLNGLDVAYSVRDGHRNADVAIMLVARKVSERIQDMYETGIIDACIHENTSSGSFLFHFNAMCATKAEQAWDKLDSCVTKVLRTARGAYNDIFKANCTSQPLDPKLLSDTADAVVDAVVSGKIDVVMSALQQHDDSTFAHLLSVASVLAFYGNEVGVRKADLNLMAQAGFAHDIGKRATPHAILYKPGPLADIEVVVMRQHSSDASSILRVSDGIPSEVIKVAERHHERMDGSGYPYGLAGAQIDDLSMVSSIGDVFSALIDRRCYKPSFSPAEALRMMSSMAGAHLEPFHTRRFIEVMDDTKFGADTAA